MLSSRYITPTLCPRTALSPHCLCSVRARLCFQFPLLVRTLVLLDSSSPYWPHFNLIISLKALFPKIPHCEGLGLQYLFQETIQPIARCQVESYRSHKTSSVVHSLYPCIFLLWLFLKWKDLQNSGSLLIRYLQWRCSVILRFLSRVPPVTAKQELSRGVIFSRIPHTVGLC